MTKYGVDNRNMLTFQQAFCYETKPALNIMTHVWSADASVTLN
jgi:hypothetical protein